MELSIIDAFKACVAQSKPNGARFLPKFDAGVLIDLCQRAVAVLHSLPSLVSVLSPVTVVGDIHGSISDLFAIFRANGFPPDTRYLFLGDYVDRGEFSVPVVTFLLALVCAYPDRITLIRGNHEFAAMCRFGGFRDEVLNDYPPTVFNHFVTAFAHLPLAAVVDDRAFCVHGGITPNLTSLQQIYDVKRPIETWDSELVEFLVWADPSRFGSASQRVRQNEIVFGVKAVDAFYQNTKLSCIIRGHECVASGIEVNERMSLITVYSAGSCEKSGTGCSGALTITADGELEPAAYKSKFLSRGDVTFIEVQNLRTEVKRVASSPGIAVGESKPKLLAKPDPLVVPWRRVSK